MRLSFPRHSNHDVHHNLRSCRPSKDLVGVAPAGLRTGACATRLVSEVVDAWCGPRGFFGGHMAHVDPMLPHLRRSLSSDERIGNDGEYFTDQFLSLSFYGPLLKATESERVEVMSSKRRKRRASALKGRCSHGMCLEDMGMKGVCVPVSQPPCGQGRVACLGRPEASLEAHSALHPRSKMDFL